MAALLDLSRNRFAGRTARFAMIAAVLLVAGALKLADANPAISQTAALRAIEADRDPGVDPLDRAWDKANHLEVPLTAQAGSYAAGGSVSTAQVRALHHDGHLFVRVDWADETADESAVAVEDFADGAAVEFPANASASVPSVCMGQAGAAVNIWHWRADSEQGPLDPGEAYASSLIDAVPSDEEVYYTARAAGNPYAQRDASPVQDLVARSFGTLSAMPEQAVAGHGVYADGRWYVVFSRGFEPATGDQTSFREGQTTDMAVAIWDGSKDERNGQKAVSSFARVHLVAGAGGGNDTTMIALSVGALAFFTLVGLGLATYGMRERGGR